MTFPVFFLFNFFVFPPRAGGETRILRSSKRPEDEHKGQIR